MLAKTPPVFRMTVSGIRDLPGVQVMGLQTAPRMVAAIAMMRETGADSRRILALEICLHIWMDLTDRLFALPFDDSRDRESWSLCEKASRVNDVAFTLLSDAHDRTQRPAMFASALEDDERIDLYMEYVAALADGLRAGQQSVYLRLSEMARAWKTVFVEGDVGAIAERACLLDVAAEQLEAYELLLMQAGGETC